ncbi:hypothetical protein RCL1_007681 [Eukaryota sp. TZLM3-RCL]
MFSSLIVLLSIIFVSASCNYIISHQIQNHSLNFKWSLLQERIYHGHFSPGVPRTIWPASTMNPFNVETQSAYSMSLDYQLTSQSSSTPAYTRLFSEFNAINASWECSTLTKGASFSSTGTMLDHPLCTFAVFDNIENSVKMEESPSNQNQTLEEVEIFFYNRDDNVPMYLFDVRGNNVDVSLFPAVLPNNTYTFVKLTPYAPYFDFTVTYEYLGQPVIMSGLLINGMYIASGISQVSSHHSVMTGTLRTSCNGNVCLKSGFGVPYFSDFE